MFVAAEMATITHAWGADLSKAEASEHQKRLVAELSEPVTQRILRSFGSPGPAEMALREALVYADFWPNEAQTTTNVLCAIMQARPCTSHHLESMCCVLQHVRSSYITPPTE